MNRISVIKENLIHNSTPRRLLAVVLGNVIMCAGVAALKLSLMGNDPFTASTMAISDGLHVGLGNYQLTLNLILIIVQIIWGYQYIGMGTLINMCLAGYIVQFSAIPIEALIGSGAGHGLVYCLIYMLGALLVVALGLSMYQLADLGVAPYDYLSMGMTHAGKLPYFVNRVITDATCVAIILAAVAVGFIGWENSHLGIGTVVCAFCLGPFVAMFNRINRKWIK